MTPVLPACDAESADAFFEDARADIVAGLHEGLATHMTHCEKIKNPYMHVAEGNKPYFHEGEFDRVGRGEVDIQYVSKDGCRFLGLWSPACGSGVRVGGGPHRPLAFDSLATFSEHKSRELHAHMRPQQRSALRRTSPDPHE